MFHLKLQIPPLWLGSEGCSGLFWRGLGGGLRIKWDLEWAYKGLKGGYANTYDSAGKELATSQFLFSRPTIKMLEDDFTHESHMLLVTRWWENGVLFQNTN